MRQMRNWAKPGDYMFLADKSWLGSIQDRRVWKL